MSDLADRHAGTAGGLIRGIGDTIPQTVVVQIAAEVAARRDVQHVAALAINLLARCDKVVKRVILDCPVVALRPGIIPQGITPAITLPDALLTMAHAIGSDAVHVTATSSGRVTDTTNVFTIVLGPGNELSGAWRVHGNGWRGLATRHAITNTADSDLPFGPYIAACLAVAAVTWQARAKRWHGDHMELSAWDLAASVDSRRASRVAAGPSSLPEVPLDIVLAGVGAVGTAFLLTLWATPTATGLIRAADPDTVDTTNRNRCPLFFAHHVDHKKALIAQSLLNTPQLAVEGIGEPVERHISSTSHVVSAVDPEAREAIQQRYPRSLIQASTHNVRVELLRCDPTVPTACIRCYNARRIAERSDDELRAELAAGGNELIERRAAESGGDASALREWVTTGLCSEVVGDMLALFRTLPGENAFSVGFASALAGTLLAAQTVKDALIRERLMPAYVPPLVGRTARAVYPLLNLGAATTGPRPYGRDPKCPACEPTSAAAGIWRTRYTG